MGRVCADCHRDLPRTSYTTNQWSKGQGVSRCASCVHGHHSDAPAAAPLPDAGRYNLSEQATFSHYELDNPFSSGAFRWVAKGRYEGGSRSGQACVLKWFKTGEVFEQDYFTLDIRASGKALEIVNYFNHLNIVDKTVKVNVPAVWTFDAFSGHRAGQKALCEPFIQNYQKFNSNTGWADESRPWARAMQALSHFSYHVTRGNYVLCDLQGGIYQHEVVLSDPVILSRVGEYGVTDLGPQGISSFFSQHTCNSYCRPNWTRPANPLRHFAPVPGTTMIRRDVPTAGSRPTRTRFYG
ncbi:kinase-like domain-containing protein [Staphylotrichum tortipilum]|uniref:Kinase-like domain-containing protein n=1 Tax=Staphylotrichum tortipilum TaxID=2831512 RepID=A0AAN6M996_9PEZI|nr:kinase-like domain-containing protein [Staphylotrichum longicolle]